MPALPKHQETSGSRPLRTTHRLITLKDLDNHYHQNEEPVRPALPDAAKLTIYLLCFVFFLLAAVASLNVAWTSGEVPQGVHTRSVTVKPGDTLWGISEAAAGQGAWSVQGVEDWIAQHNHLGDVLQAGSVIRIPVR